MFAHQALAARPGDVGQHARGRDHERRVARRERGELGEHVRLGGIAAHAGSAGRRRRCRAPHRSVAARPSSPGHTRLMRNRRSSGIRGIERSEVDARAPHDLRHPQRRIAGDRALQRRPSTGRPPGRGRRPPPIPVRVAVGVEAQAGARADLEQGDRPVDAAQCGQQRRAPQRLVRLQAADASTPRPRHRRAAAATPPSRGTALPAHRACA